MRYALAIVALCGLTIGLLLSTTPNASAAPSLQLPWPVGVSHYIDVDQCTYNCLPYHVGSDLYAIDFHFPIVGDSVVASAAGTFVDGHNDPVNWDNRGNFLEIDHGGGYRTRYLHLSASQPWAPGIGINVTVTAGQLIAYSGNTGGVPAHLHFDVKLNGNAFKPENMSNVLDIAGGQTFGWYGANTGVRSPSWVADITTWHNWQDWGPIADAPPTAVSYDPTRRDHTHEAWRSGSDVMFRWWDGSIWQPAQNLSGGPSDPNFTGPVGISNHGNGIYVVGVSSGSSGEVWFKKYEPTTGWSTWSYLGRPPDGGIDGPVGVAFDPGDGQAHVVGVHAGTVFLKYGTTGNWIGWQNLGGSGTILNSVAVANRGGLVHVVGSSTVKR